MLLQLHFLIFIAFWKGILSSSAIWYHTIDEKENQYTFLSSYLYKDAFVSFLVICEEQADVPISVSWILEEADCMDDMYNLPQKTTSAIVHLVPLFMQKGRDVKTLNSFKFSDQLEENVSYKRKKVQIGNTSVIECGGGKHLSIPNESAAPYASVYIPTTQQGERNKSDEKTVVMETEKDLSTMAHVTDHQILRVWEDGMYHFLFKIHPLKNSSHTGKIIIKMAGLYGFLSAIEWPLLPFNGVMSFLYLITGTCWLMLWARAHEHSTKIHILIGVVAAVGGGAATLTFVEKVSLNQNGVGLVGIKWFCELLQAGQNSLLQLLLMIVSTGYGITRPVMTGSLISIMLILAGTNFLTEIPYIIVLDENLRIKYSYPAIAKTFQVIHIAAQCIIAGWIMIAAINTFIHLWGRKHSRKIKTFSIFMGSCILAFLGLLVIFIMSYGWLTACRKNWKLEWLFGSMWQMESLALLLVLMWLWQPKDQAQSYSFSPVGDLDRVTELSDEEEDEIDIVDDNVILNKSKRNHLQLEIL